MLFVNLKNRITDQCQDNAWDEKTKKTKRALNKAFKRLGKGGKGSIGNGKVVLEEGFSASEI
jgi:CRISPR/Cas system CMR subunit Cmr6 (Cas7 group RAMP superfamily)